LLSSVAVVTANGMPFLHAAASVDRLVRTTADQEAVDDDSGNHCGDKGEAWGGPQDVVVKETENALDHKTGQMAPAALVTMRTGPALVPSGAPCEVATPRVWSPRRRPRRGMSVNTTTTRTTTTVVTAVTAVAVVAGGGDRDRGASTPPVCCLGWVLHGCGCG